jgi:hypothetical protein
MDGALCNQSLVKAIVTKATTGDSGGEENNGGILVAIIRKVTAVEKIVVQVK